MESSADGRTRPELTEPDGDLQRAHATDHAEDGRPSRVRRMRVLALTDTSAAFTSSRRSDTEVFPAMAAQLADRLVGGCLIRPWPGTGDRLQVAAGHVHMHARSRLLSLMQTSPGALGSAYCAWVADRGRSILTPHVSRKALRGWTEPAAWPFLEEFDICTFLVVPVRAADQILGTVTVWREQPGQPFDADDQVFAEEVGRRLVPA